MNRLLKLSRNLSGLIFLLLIISGCSREDKKTEYIARVNNSYLTEEDLTAVTGKGYSGQKFFKEEAIRNWVNRELLYQQALKEGILDEERYKNLMKNSGKELAAAMMIEKIYSENIPVYKPEDVRTYFSENQDIFRLNETAYLVNIAEFSNEDKAISFRSAAVESDWNKALNFFNKDAYLIRQDMNKLLFLYDLQPLKLQRLLNELYPGEVSLIINGENNNYIVVNLISRLEAGTIPPFDVIKENVEKRFIAGKKTEKLKEYYENLYSSNEIDVKQ